VNGGHGTYLSSVKMKARAIDKGIRSRIAENRERVFGDIAVVIIEDDFRVDACGFERRSEIFLDE
jgi:predicted transposase YbfD/YdcC